MQLDCGMRILHEMHLRNPPDWFYDLIPEFLYRYDRVNAEWRGLAFSRPSFDRPPSAHDMDIDPSAPSSSQQPPLSISQKRMREVVIF